MPVTARCGGLLRIGTGERFVVVVMLATLLSMAGCEEPTGPYTLIGKAPPPFKAELLDGGELTLSKHLGKDVVILDFWAKWCDPCIKAMPQIIEVAAEYESQGVVLYAVNEGDTPRDITEFLAEERLHVNVALDPDGVLGEAFLVSSIPQTVIIGRDGKVEVVHVGVGPGLKTELRRQLDDLIAGRTPPRH